MQPVDDPQAVPVGIVTISDRAFAGTYEDKGGPGIVAALADFLETAWRAEMRLVPDEQAQIEAVLKELADERGCALILTTGGTGPSPRDVTPEATLAVADKIMPGFGELMRQVSLSQTPTAILSRQVAAHRGKCLAINLPGKPAAIELCLDAVMPATPYCLDLIGAAWIDTDPAQVKTMRPKVN